MTKRIFKALPAAILSVFFGSAMAEWRTSTAAEMGEACQLDRGESPSNASTRFSLCSMPIMGFIDGYKRGAAKGMRTAFIEDAANLATTKGIDDLQNRIGILRRSSECLPPTATTEQVEKVFINFVASHPERQQSAYPAVLSDAIEDYFCPVR